jgi:hypothetical protein
VVTEAETNATNHEMVDMDLALKTGDLRWEEMAAQEMGPQIGDLQWEEMAAQTIDKGTMIEGDNQSSTSATLILIYTVLESDGIFAHFIWVH